jgi:glycosyltransferase involved in cell wall biosynthesis
MSAAVTVIIAAYNAEAFIAGAVRSALAQTLRDIEVLVVDDGSRDRTAGVAVEAAAGDPRFRLTELPKNGGVAAARNAGLRGATGHWIAVLDADDSYAPERLERLVETAERDGADLLADNVRLIEADADDRAAFALPQHLLERPLGVHEFIALDTPGLETLPAGFMKPIMRRSFLSHFDLWYPEEISCGEDFDLYVRCLLRGARLSFVPEAYYSALVRRDSLSRANPERNNTALLRSLKTLIADARHFGNRRAARLLARRANDIVAYDAYSQLADALHRRRLAAAVSIFPHLMTRSYIWRRFGMAARRRLAVS